jgi:hypothetical protein
MPAKPKAKATPKPAPARPGKTRAVALSFYAETEEQLAFLCARVAHRQGRGPDLLRSSIVRSLIAGEYRRERDRESAEGRGARD